VNQTSTGPESTDGPELIRHRGADWRWAAGLAALALCASCAHAPGTGKGVAANVAELRQLSAAQIRAGTTVRLEGTLTYLDHLSNYCFVEDSTGGVRVELAPGETAPEAGWRVQITGLAASAGWSPSVVEGRLRPIRAEIPGTPGAVSGQKLLDPANQFRRIAVSGVVRSLSSERAGLEVLEIRTQGATVWAKVPASQIEVGGATADAEVRVIGVLAESATGDPTLWLVNTEAISILRAAIRPDALPVSRIGTLTHLDAGHLPTHRVRVRGIPYVTVDKQLALMDEAAAIPVRLEWKGDATRGGELDVAGFVEWENGRAILQQAAPVREDSAAGRERGAKANATLTNVRRVRELPTAIAQQGRPVHLRAVVTFYDPGNSLLFVEDRTDGTFVELSDANGVHLKAGDEVEITGETTADFAPNIGKAHVRVVGHAGLPQPGVSSVGVALTGSEDSHWTRLPGIVQQVTQERADSLLTLVWGRERYKAHVLADSASLASLVDAEVRIRGVCGSLFNRKRQLLGIQLFVPGTEFIEVVRRPGTDPFSQAPSAVADLMRFSAAHQNGHRVRLRGVVTYADRGGVTWMRDVSGGVMLQDVHAEGLAAGDLVDVAGFPTIARFSPALRGTQLRRLGAGRPPTPVRITAEDAMKGDFDSQLVEVEGKLMDQLHQPAGHVLAMASGGSIFEAELPGGITPAGLDPGTLLGLTGICTVEVAQSHDLILPRSFRIMLRSPADIQVLKRPSLLTPERVGPVVAGGALLIVAGLGWVAMLRKRVRKQTDALRSQTVQLQTAHQRARDALRKVSEAESVQRESNAILELIARDSPVDAIADHIAEAIASQTEECACVVLLADHHKVRVLAVPVLPGGWMESLHRLAIGSISFSAEFREPAQLSSDPAWATFIRSQTSQRFRTCCTSPIIVEGATAGAIATFFRSDKPPRDANEMQLASWCNVAALALDRRRLHDQLSYRAQHDKLTGLPNRDLLHERLEEEIAKASRGDGLLGLLYIDLDEFKKINDTHGHDAGDAVLRQAARRMTHSVRRGDMVARIGGDEFVVLLPRLGRKEDAGHIADKLAAVLREPVYACHQKLGIGASVGIGIWPIDGESPGELLRYADGQMYGQKRRRWYETPAPSQDETGVPAG
jgi:diguanylate cyclase (GGDEF)-like protein